MKIAFMMFLACYCGIFHLKIEKFNLKLFFFIQIVVEKACGCDVGLEMGGSYSLLHSKLMYVDK